MLKAPRFFDADGNQLDIKPVGELQHIAEIGGLPKRTGVTLSIYSETLDRHQVTRLLAINPTAAWNPHERHTYGNKRHGKTRETDWGKWYLSIASDDSPLNEKIEKLFAECTQDLNNWRQLSEDYHTWLTIVVDLDNFNREVHLSRKTLNLISERKLDLTFDVYFDLKEDEDADSDLVLIAPATAARPESA